MELRRIAMPLFDFLCMDCGETSELLIAGSDESPRCKTCGGHNLKKLVSAHSSLSGPNKNRNARTRRYRMLWIVSRPGRLRRTGELLWKTTHITQSLHCGFFSFCGKTSLITPRSTRRTQRLYILFFFSFVTFVVKIKPIFFGSGLCLPYSAWQEGGLVRVRSYENSYIINI